METSLRLACDPSAPAIVRASLLEMPGIDEVRDDALLIASELVTNAVLHSGGSRDEWIVVKLVRSAGSLLISVADPGKLGGTAEVELGQRRHGGWGLRVVSELASRWGRERESGHRVWAELAL